MKRNLVIASITAAALIGAGTYTTVALAATDNGADTAPKTVSSASLVNGAGATDDNRDDDFNDDGDDFNGNGTGNGNSSGKDDTKAPATGSKLTAEQAAAAALGQHPGKVESVDLDDDDDDDGSSVARHWEVDIIGQDGKWYDLRVDAATGAVRVDKDDDDDNDDDRHERALVNGAQVDARAAAAAALKKHPGAVTSVDADDDDRKAGHWEVTVRGDDGASHTVTVDMKTGAVAADRDDDSDDRGDHADDRDDRDDDHGDDDGRDDDHGDDDGRDDDGHDDRGDDDGDDD
ncbi:PepSY domain-containing protein [Streptomyces sp. NPDC006645]|uniref:PepSY domain-containing protein n=1 Tax=unclassified Streptomyces TaxID=2593676 RepID=UPI0033AB2FE1